MCQPLHAAPNLVGEIDKKSATSARRGQCCERHGHRCPGSPEGPRRWREEAFWRAMLLELGPERLRTSWDVGVRVDMAPGGPMKQSKVAERSP